LGKRIYRTIQNSVTLNGIGVHSGIKTRVKLLPSDEGISFIKKENDATKIIASIDNVVNTVHGTTIGNGTVSFGMVEHLLGALLGFEIDGMTIVFEKGDELPILDGSALPIVEKFRNIKIIEKKVVKRDNEVIIDKPFLFNFGKSHLALYPSPKLVISYFINYENYPELTQMKTVEVTQEHFVKEIAPARTYAFHEWVEPLRKQGLIKGGSLENSLVYSKKGLLNKTPLRFKDEFVRHKILDFIGDLLLLEKRVVGHFVILCGGHTAHIAFLKQLKKIIDREEYEN